MTRLPLAALAAASLLGAAASSAAATVEVREGRAPTTNSRVPVAFFQAAPGEANRVTIQGFEATTIRVTDAGAPLTAGAGCTQVDAHTAECVKPPNPAPGDYPWLHYAELQLGDGDDTVRGGAHRVGITADGGPGADVLEGSEIIDDRLTGGGGRDRLLGHAGDDWLTDGDDPAAPDADELDGGAGSDTVSYAARTGPVALTLAAATTGGEDGEGDAVRRIENAIGGAGADELEGTAGPNALSGGDGQDHLDGLGGNDRLRGANGRDRLHGGKGRDELDGGVLPDELRGDRGDDRMTEPSRRDDLRCGAGEDTVADPVNVVPIPRTCEVLRYDFRRQATTMTIDPRPRAVRDGTAMRFRLGCPLAEEMDGLCPIDARGTLRLFTHTAAKRPLGASALRWRLDDQDDPVLTGDTVALNRLGRRLAARRDGVEAFVRLRVRGLPDMGWVTRLRAP